MPYEFVEDIAMADIAFEAWGKTPKEMFESAALAVTNVMVKDLKSVKQKISKKFSLREDTLEKLLFNFLQEIIFYKDAEMLLFSKYSVKIKEKESSAELSCTMGGEKLNMEKHELIVDVKAVTLHHFQVKKEKDSWKCFVILDI